MRSEEADEGDEKQIVVLYLFLCIVIKHLIQFYSTFKCLVNILCRVVLGRGGGEHQKRM